MTIDSLETITETAQNGTRKVGPIYVVGDIHLDLIFQELFERKPEALHSPVDLFNKGYFGYTVETPQHKSIRKAIQRDYTLTSIPCVVDIAWISSLKPEIYGLIHLKEVVRTGKLESAKADNLERIRFGREQDVKFNSFRDLMRNYASRMASGTVMGGDNIVLAKSDILPYVVERVRGLS